MLHVEYGGHYPYTVQPRLVDGKVKHVIFNGATSWQGRYYDTYDEAEAVAEDMARIWYEFRDAADEDAA